MTNRTSYFQFFYNFFIRRLYEGVGLGLIFLGMMLALAFFSHQLTDLSFNNAIDTNPLNWMGEPGAYVSDFFLQLYGVCSYLISIFLIFTGAEIFTTHKSKKLLWRFPLFIIGFHASVCFLSLFFSTGILGNLLNKKLIDLLNPYTSETRTILPCSYFIIGFISLIFAFSLKMKHFQFFVQLFRIIKNAAWKISKMTPTRKEPSSLKEEKPNLKESSSQFSFKDSEESSHPLPEIRKKPSVDKVVKNPLDHLLPDQFNLPPMDLLSLPKGQKLSLDFDKENLKEKAHELENVLNDYGIRGEIVGVYPGPVVTLYELEPAPGLKSSRVIGLADDIARSMSAVSARVAVVPGKNVIGIELPNKHRETVHLRDLLTSSDYENSKTQLTLVLGKDISGQPVIADLTKMPHLLVAGTTGSGKSVGVNAMILSLLYKFPPEKCKFIMIDPKMLELSIYDGIPHLLAPVVTEPKKAIVALKWVVREMESRYQAMSKLAVRNIEGYNQRILEAKAKGTTISRKVQTGFNPETGHPLFEEQALDMETLPFIVVVVDEMADLMLVAGKEIESAVQRLAQMARAAGIHLIMATQRPSVDVITGTIKANFPTRISFQVTSKIDSRTILGEQGAEQLLGQGDMLYMAAGGRIFRVHGPYVGDSDVEKVVKFLKGQASPDYIEDITVGSSIDNFSGNAEEEEDELYEQALELVKREKKASTSFIQRYFKIGYNRAARLIELMESRGVISPANHVGKREILISSEEY